MNKQLEKGFCFWGTLGALSLLGGVVCAAPPQAKKILPAIVFNRDIRPILSDNCFACHGPDKNKRQSGLRLDQPNRAIVAGKPEESTLVRRIQLPETSGGHMPPASFHKRLTEPQKQLLIRWVRQGGVYQKHWSYEPPTKAIIPSGQNAIDYLVRKQLVEHGFKPSPIADKRTLMRRLSFDLLGLPPTPTEVSNFTNDTSRDAYSKQVERLLANPHYGEKMAQHWLDVVRFADTIGYHSDNARNIWPYRDWVIHSFNQNKRFDRFTREQIAGDLLPNATQETRIGSAYNRLLLTTEEGGAQAKDYEARYLTDRVRAVGTVWLGQTTACAQCHDHKFDPITMRDFYSLGAFFADIDEAIIGAREPGIQVAFPEQERELAARTSRLEELNKQFTAPHPELASARATWEEEVQAEMKKRAKWQSLVPLRATAMHGTQLSVQSDGSLLASGANPNTNTYVVESRPNGTVAGIRLDVLPDATLPAKGPGRASNGNFVLTEIKVEVIKPGAAPRRLPLGEATASFEQFLFAEGNPYRKYGASSTTDDDVLGDVWGWAILPRMGQGHHLTLPFLESLLLTSDETLRITLQQAHGNMHTLGKFRLSFANELTPQWSALKPSLATAQGGTQLTIQPNHTILASGANPSTNTYTVNTSGTHGAVAFKIDALPDSTLPNKGPGRFSNGNFVITEVTARVLKSGIPVRSLDFASAHASYEQSLVTEGNPYDLWSAASAIDKDVKGDKWGWAVLPEVGKPQSLVLVLAEKLALAEGESLQFTLRQGLGEQHTLGKFRISETKETSVVYAFAPRWRPTKIEGVSANGGTMLKVLPDNSILASGANPDKNSYAVTTSPYNTVNAVRIDLLPDPALPAKGPGRASNGNFVLTEVIARVIKQGAEPRPIKFTSAKASFEQTIAAEGNPYKIWGASAVIDNDEKGEQWGWAVLPVASKQQHIVLTLQTPYQPAEGEKLEIVLKQNLGTQHTIGRFLLSTTSDSTIETLLKSDTPEEILKAVNTPSAQRTEEQNRQITAYYNTIAPQLKELRESIAAAQSAKDTYQANLPRCIVTVKNAQPRTVRILARGNFMDESGEVVKPATPAFLPAQAQGTRLDLANWLVNRKNPLTARTIMNRLWKQFFGTGVCKILEDLGAQGEPPANAELLDWLACEFMDSGWDIKHMVRLIVSSATYRQISTADRTLITRDPYNRNLARQSRYRLDAEQIRDNALAVSGLLNLKIGGPSVKPYQPDRYWENLNFPVREYMAEKSDNQYRRGLYTWWQRSFLHPSLLAFDAPSREECAAERTRSNIPQQALVLLNDPTYVEASRAFAYRILTTGGNSAKSRVVWAWQQALQRNPTASEMGALLEVYNKQKALRQADPTTTEAFLKVGQLPIPEGCDHIDLAAWTHVARVLLNLHETITRP